MPNFLVRNEAVQMHREIRVTDKAGLGYFLKREQVAQMTLGNVAHHRDSSASLRGF